MADLGGKGSTPPRQNIFEFEALEPETPIPDPVNFLSAFGAALLGPEAVQNLGQRQARVQAVNAQTRQRTNQFNAGGAVDAQRFKIDVELRETARKQSADQREFDRQNAVEIRRMELEAKDNAGIWRSISAGQVTEDIISERAIEVTMKNLGIDPLLPGAAEQAYNHIKAKNIEFQREEADKGRLREIQERTATTAETNVGLREIAEARRERQLQAGTQFKLINLYMDSLESRDPAAIQKDITTIEAQLTVLWGELGKKGIDNIEDLKRVDSVKVPSLGNFKVSQARLLAILASLDKQKAYLITARDSLNRGEAFDDSTILGALRFFQDLSVITFREAQDDLQDSAGLQQGLGLGVPEN